MFKWEYLYPLVGYFCGAIPMAYLISRYFYGIDIRTQGSGNVGATNTLRALGTRAGAIVLLLDIAKVILVLIVGQILQLPREILLITAAAAIIGHNWPVYLRFKGGKGVAVSAGMMFWFYPLPGLLSVLVFVVVVYLTRYVSLGSILAAAIVPFVLAFMGYPRLDVIYTAFLAAMLIWGHRGNIQRLLQGTERRLSFAAKT